MICPRCKAAVPEGALFCGNCGMRLEKTDAGVQMAKTSGQNYASQQVPEPQQPGGQWQTTGQQPTPGMQGVEPRPMSKKEAKKAARQSADKASKKGEKQSTKKAAKQSAGSAVPKEPKKNAGSAAPKEPKKSAKKGAKKGGSKVGIILGILAAVIVAAAAVAVAVVFLLTKKTEVNLNDYLTVSISEGTNTQGTASYSFDEEQFIQDYADTIELTGDGETEYGAYIGSYFYPNAATLLVYEILDGGGDLSPSSGLSNGDTVTFTWDLDEETIEQYFNITVKCSDITVTVSGLEEVEELEEVDVFEYITVVFEGMSPEGTAKIKVTGGDYSDDDFSLDMDSGLSSGDVVTVTFNAQESMEASGKTPAATSKTYTAELAKYVSSLDDVTDEFFAECQNEIDNIFEEEISDWDSRVTFVSMTYVTDYLQTLKEENPNYATYSLYLTYEIVADQNGDEVIYYWYIGFGDVILNADGTYEVDFENIDIPETSSYLREGTEFDCITYSEEGSQMTQTYKGYISMAELYEDLIAGDDNFTYEGTPYTE